MPKYPTYVKEPIVDENSFRGAPSEDAELPAFEGSREALPEPSWEGHEAALECYRKVWELAFRNLRKPTPASGFVANFIDTAFNDCLFMWDSAFILMFARYGRRAFDFQRTLDNFYAKQHPDGYICREIYEPDGEERFERFDPTGTGPNVMPWTEWEYFLNYHDTERLARVFPPLVAYHRWFRRYRTWPDGTYWASGWACGMDNQPRLPEGEHELWSHGHMTWADTCLQALFSARVLLDMSRALGREAELDDMKREIEFLGGFVNEVLWDDTTSFYYDRFRDGKIADVKSVAAYWALLAGIVPEDKLDAFCAHLQDEKEFNRPHRVPSLSADHPVYRADGGYWQGGVWPPTNYMVLRGLTRAGRDDLAHEIAMNHLANVYEVFGETGTVFENYAPESASPGSPAKPDFVGWSGLGPVAVLFEYAFGLRADVPAGKLVWDVRLLEAHGVERYPFGADGLLDLKCAARSSAGEKPVTEVKSNVPVELEFELRWKGGSEVVKIGGR